MSDSTNAIVRIQNPYLWLNLCTRTVWGFSGYRVPIRFVIPHVKRAHQNNHFNEYTNINMFRTNI
jgi:hypothetical protein